MGGLGDQTLVKELCLLRLPEVFLRHCPCFPPLFGRSDGQIIAGEEMFGASGTFMLLILQSFTAAAPPIYTNATKRGIKLGYLGRSFCRRTFLREARFVKVPFIAALFQPLGPKLILVLKITQRDLDYVF